MGCIGKIGETKRVEWTLREIHIEAANAKARGGGPTHSFPINFAENPP